MNGAENEVVLGIGAEFDVFRDATGSVPPLVQDYPGEYTHGMPFLRSDLQNRVLQQKLTPNLPSLVPVMTEELEFAMKVEMPDCAGL